MTLRHRGKSQTINGESWRFWWNAVCGLILADVAAPALGQKPWRKPSIRCFKLTPERLRPAGIKCPERSVMRSMHDPRRLSLIGADSTGWRSSFETNPRQSFRSFVGQLLIAAAAFILILIVLVTLGSPN